MLNRNEQEREKQISRYLFRLRIFDTAAVLLAIFGWFWEYIEYELYFVQIQSEKTDSLGRQVLDLLDVNESPHLSSFRAMASVSTAILLFMVYKRYEAQVEIDLLREDFVILLSHSLKPDNKMSERTRQWLRMIPWMIIEFIVLTGHSIPRVNYNFETSQQGQYLEYNLDTIFSVIINLRIYLVARLMRHYSKWMGQAAVTVCKTQDTEATLGFAIKAILTEHPVASVVAFLLFLLFFAGISERAFERPFGLDPNKLGNVLNSVWCNFAIVTTVGYGDYYPRTHAGRVIAVFTCIAGQFFVSITVATLTRIVEFTDRQTKAYYTMLSLLPRQELEELAANFIKFAFKQMQSSKVKKVGANTKTDFFKFWLFMKRFQTKRKEIVADQLGLPTEFFIDKCKQAFSNKKYTMIKAVRAIDNLNKRVNSIEENTNLIEKALNSIHAYNKNMLNALQTAAVQTTHLTTFDRLHLNPGALNTISELDDLSPPMDLITKEFPEFDLNESTNKPLATSLDKITKKHILQRFEKAKYAVDPELVKMMDDKAMPKIPLRQKRAIANTQGAKEVVSILLDLQRKKKREKTVKGSYISGEVLGQTILDITTDKKGISQSGLPSLTENDDEIIQSSEFVLQDISPRKTAGDKSPSKGDLTSKAKAMWMKASGVKTAQKVFQKINLDEEEAEVKRGLDGASPNTKSDVSLNRRGGTKKIERSNTSALPAVKNRLISLNVMEENKDEEPDVPELPLSRNCSIGYAQSPVKAKNPVEQKTIDDEKFENILGSIEPPLKRTPSPPSWDKQQVTKNNKVGGGMEPSFGGVDPLEEFKRAVIKVNPTLQEMRSPPQNLKIPMINFDDNRIASDLMFSPQRIHVGHSDLNTLDRKLGLGQERKLSQDKRSDYYYSKQNSSQIEDKVTEFKRALDGLFDSGAPRRESNTTNLSSFETGMTYPRSRKSTLGKNVMPNRKDESILPDLSELNSNNNSIISNGDGESGLKDYTTSNFIKDFYRDRKQYKAPRDNSTQERGRLPHTETEIPIRFYTHRLATRKISADVRGHHVESSRMGYPVLEDNSVKPELYMMGRYISGNNGDRNYFEKK